MPSWRSNRLTELLGIRYPILTGAFGGLSAVELTAAVSNGGGLGAYGLYGYPADRIARTVAELRTATEAPFLLNLWVSDEDEAQSPDPAEFAAAADRLRPFFSDLGLEVPEPPARLLPSFAEQVDAVLEARPAAVGFVFGVPGEEVLAASGRRASQWSAPPPRWRRPSLSRTPVWI